MSKMDDIMDPVKEDLRVFQAEVDQDEPMSGFSVSRLSRPKTFSLVAALTFMFFCNSGSIQSMNVAIGFIAEDLRFTPAEVQWIQSSYELASGALLLLFIPLSDKFGAKPIFLFGAGCFCVSAIAIANCTSAIQFIVFRAFEGVGACAAVPSGFSILHQLLPVVEGSTFRSTMFAVYAWGAPIGSGMGTICGGLPTQYSKIMWRGIFAVYAGVSGCVFIAVLLLAPKSELSDVPGGVDYTGAAIVTAGLTLFIFCLAQGPAVGWKTGYIIGLLIIGILALVAFVFYEIWLERKGSTPMLRMSNFKRGRYLAMNILGLIAFGSFITWDYFAGLWYAAVLHMDAENIMLRYLPQSLGGLIGGPIATYLLRRVSVQVVFMLGCAMGMGGNLIFALAQETHTYWNHAQFLAFFLNITCACFIFTTGMVYCVSVVDPKEANAAGGLFQVMTSLASSFGLVFGVLVASGHGEGNETVYYQYGFWTAFSYACFALLMAIPCFWGIGKIKMTGSVTEQVEAEGVALGHV